MIYIAWCVWLGGALYTYDLLEVRNHGPFYCFFNALAWPVELGEKLAEWAYNDH